MNTIRIKFLGAAIGFTSMLSVVADSNNNSAPFINFRPASRDIAGKIVGTTSHHTAIPEMETFYGTLSSRFKYSQSLKSSGIAKAFLGSSIVTGTADDNQQVVVSGSAVSGRASTDLLAENFYLPRDFKSTLTFKPKVQRFQVDFNFYMALDEWVEGLYFRVFGPFVHSRHELGFNEQVNKAGTAGYEAGFFDKTPITSGNLLSSFADYAAGTKTVTSSTVKANALQYAKIDNQKHSENEFELRFEVGYNILLDEDYHFGLNFQAAAPTSRKPHAVLLFESTAGNGKHWEVGGGITSHYTVWRSEDDEKRFDFVFEADFTHLLKARQTRTFDLKGKPLSRYALAEKMIKNVDVAAGNPTTKPNYQFAAEYAPVANITTLDVKTSVGVQADVVGMFNFTCRGWSLDLGYEFFGGSTETIHQDTDADDKLITFAANTWALKGLSSVYGFENTNTIALSATDSAATVNSSKVSGLTNTGVDSAVAAYNATSNQALNATTSSGSAINTSSAPVLIALTDIDFEGAETKLQSHKIFTHVNYTWIDREDWIPFIGIGAEVEFGRGSHHNDADDKTTTTVASNVSSTVNGALSQWGVWLKGGLSFN